jgi:hypothetical protein
MGHFQVLCRQPSPAGAARGTNVSKESKTSASRTFLTDMLHFNTATDKVPTQKATLYFCFLFQKLVAGYI